MLAVMPRFLEIGMVSKHPGTHSARALCALHHISRLVLARPGDIVGANEDMSVPGVCVGR